MCSRDEGSLDSSSTTLLAPPWSKIYNKYHKREPRWQKSMEVFCVSCVREIQPDQHWTILHTYKTDLWINTTICTNWTTEFSRYTVQRGELGEREAAEGRELLLQAERGRRWRGNMGKAPLPKSSWRQSGKVETATGTELKREKGERRGFTFH